MLQYAELSPHSVGADNCYEAIINTVSAFRSVACMSYFISDKVNMWSKEWKGVHFFFQLLELMV